MTAQPEHHPSWLAYGNNGWALWLCSRRASTSDDCAAPSFHCSWSPQPPSSRPPMPPRHWQMRRDRDFLPLIGPAFPSDQGWGPWGGGKAAMENGDGAWGHAARRVLVCGARAALPALASLAKPGKPGQEVLHARRIASACLPCLPAYPMTPETPGAPRRSQPPYCSLPCGAALPFQLPSAEAGVRRSSAALFWG